MFCENCGQQIPDGSTFCSNCGAPAGKPAQEMPVEQQPVEQPVEQQPVEQPVQEQAPFDPQDQFNASAQQYEPAPAAPKQPVSPKTKKIIMFSAIGAGALAVILVALFVFIIPAISNANKLSLADYCTVQFDGIDYDKSSESSSEADKAEKKLTDGKLSGYITWDTAKFAKDADIPEDKASSILGDFKDCFNADYFINGEEYYSNRFEDLGKDDTVKVTFKYDDSDSSDSAYGELISKAAKQAAEKKFDELEKTYGVKFKRETTSHEFKLNDVLDEQGIALKGITEVKLLDYIKSENLITNSDDLSGDVTVSVKEFEFTESGYKFTHADSSSYVYIYENDNEIGDVRLEFDNEYYLKNGDTVKLTLDEYSVSSMLNKGIKLTGDPVSYTVKAEEPTTEAETTEPTTVPASTGATEATGTTSEVKGMSLAEAQKNAEGLKDFALANLEKQDSKITAGDKVTVKNIYYCDKPTSDYRRIVFIYQDETAKFFRAVEINPEYLSVENGKVVSSSDYFSKSREADTLEQAVENCWYLSKNYSKFYTNTKIL